MTYFEVLISKTCRERGHCFHAGFRRYEDERLKFETVEALQTWLDEEYGGCSRAKIYRDPNATHVGYIYSRIAPGVRDCPGGYYERHWVSVNRVESAPFIVRASRRRGA